MTIPENGDCRTKGLTRVLQSPADSVDGELDDGAQAGLLLLGQAPGAQAAEQLDLEGIEGIDVGIAKLDRLPQDALAAEQLPLAGDDEDGALGARELVE